jgi:peptidoglycan/xylan/chitin deacetylase (PgdA/CDA1 family)
MTSAAAPVAVILSYHRVAELAPDTHGLCVGVETLRAHMEEVGRHYRPVPLESVADGVTTGAIPPGAVAVSFDDGYLDALESASPVLAACGIPATFFVTTERLDEKHETWWDVLERIFLGGERIPRVLDLGSREGGALTASLSSRDERRTVHRMMHRKLVAMAHGERSALLQRIADWSGLDLAPRETHRLMVAGELRRLAERAGHRIGAHTVHHVWLPAETRDTRRGEIAGSKAALEALLSCPVGAFSYPYGAVDDDVVEAVRSGSFRMAVTTAGDAVRRGADPLRLPRWEVGACSGAQFAARLGSLFRGDGPSHSPP